MTLRRRTPLLAVLCVLIGAIVAVIAFGVTLILQRERPISAAPPGASSALDRHQTHQVTATNLGQALFDHLPDL